MSRIAVLTATLALAGAAPALALPTATITNGPGFSVPSAPSLPDHPVNVTNGTVNFTFSGSGIDVVECRNYDVAGATRAYGPCDSAMTSPGSHAVTGAPETIQRFQLHIHDLGG